LLTTSSTSCQAALMRRTIFSDLATRRDAAIVKTPRDPTA
jgi:hypothetical protein